jgi:hypothetical protein
VLFVPFAGCVTCQVKGGADGNLVGYLCRAVTEVVCHARSRGGGGISESGGKKRRLMAKAPRPPKWPTVKGTRAT